MSQPSIFRKTAGPIVVRGEINLTDEEGNPIKHGPRFSLCGCGTPDNMPFCDGAHKTQSFAGVVLNGIIFRPLLVVGENKTT